MLIRGSHIQFSLRNLNISAKSLKGGMKYVLSGELPEEDWMKFIDSDLCGSLFEVHDMECVEVAEAKPEKPKKPKGGPQSKNAAMLRQDISFARFVAEIFGFEDVRKFMYSHCKIDSLAELDHNEAALEAYESLRKSFHDWERSP
jgi:hypothetical protein